MGTGIRLLTLNTLAGGAQEPRLRVLGQALAGMRLDVVCLQEMVWRRHIPSVTSEFPHAAYVPRGPFVRGGLLTLSRWPISPPQFIGYRVGSGPRPDFLDRLLRKGLLRTRISIAGWLVTVINTHLPANFGGDWSHGNPYARAEEAALAQLTVAITTETRDPVVVMGDLNVPRGSWLLNEFMDRAGLRDVLAGDPRPTYRPTPKIPDPGALDHVLVRPGISRDMGAEADLVFEEPVPLPGGGAVYLSDHVGVQASIQLGD